MWILLNTANSEGENVAEQVEQRNSLRQEWFQTRNNESAVMTQPFTLF